MDDTGIHSTRKTWVQMYDRRDNKQVTVRVWGKMDISTLEPGKTCHSSSWRAVFMKDFKPSLIGANPVPYLCRMQDPAFRNWEKKSAERQKVYKRLLDRADKNKVLRELPDLHEEAFQKVDCLQCAACCKNYSPRFKTPDIKRISKLLKMRESAFIDTYLNLDPEGDYVVKSSPCPFLGSDNFCSIYEDRPSDCRRFPYTDEDVLLQRKPLTLTNSTFCPAVYFDLEKMNVKLG